MKTFVQVALAIVLVIAVLVGAAFFWLRHSYGGGRAMALANAQKFCEAIVLGADIATVTARRRGDHRTPAGGNEYRYSSFAGAYQEAQCRVQVDAQGRIVAKQAALADEFPHDSASAASAAISG